MRKLMKNAIVFLLIAISAMMLAACGGVPEEPEKAKENLEKNEYSVTEITVTANGTVAVLAGIGATGSVTKAYVASNDDGESVLIVYFNDEGMAKELESKVKELYKSLVGEPTGEESENSDTSGGRSGKALYFGTSAAIKAAN